VPVSVSGSAGLASPAPPRPALSCPALHAGLCEGPVRWTYPGRWRQAFWIFSGLCSRVCALYFGEGLTGIQVDAAVVEQLVEERVPACARQVGARTPLWGDHGMDHYNN
jgi:hypothetical protein